MADLASLELRALSELADCGDEAALRAWNTKYFGKSGEVLQALKGVGVIPADQRRAYGQEANRIKESLTQAHDSKQTAIKQEAIDRTLTSEAVDVTLPGRPVQRGRLHVTTKIMREITAIFADLGFQVYRRR